MSIEHISQANESSFGDLSEDAAEVDVQRYERDIFKGIAEAAIRTGDVQTGHEAELLDEFMHQPATKHSSN